VVAGDSITGVAVLVCSHGIAHVALNVLLMGREVGGKVSSFSWSAAASPPALQLQLSADCTCYSVHQLWSM
jgi:hypothetical protein